MSTSTFDGDRTQFFFVTSTFERWYLSWIPQHRDAEGTNAGAGELQTELSLYFNVVSSEESSNSVAA